MSAVESEPFAESDEPFSETPPSAEWRRAMPEQPPPSFEPSSLPLLSLLGEPDEPSELGLFESGSSDA